MKRKWIVILMIIGLVLVSCSKQGKNEYTVGQELTIEGKTNVIDNDGEVYLIVTDKGDYFDVHNMDEKYKQKGIPIKVNAKILDLRCLHGVGIAVEVKEYLK